MGKPSLNRASEVAREWVLKLVGLFPGELVVDRLLRGFCSFLVGLPLDSSSSSVMIEVAAVVPVERVENLTALSMVVVVVVEALLVAERERL